MISKEDHEKGILCRGMCTNCKDRFGCIQSTVKPTEDELFAFNLYEEYPREVLILAMGQYQAEHVKAFNEVFSYKKKLEELIKWTTAELTSAEHSFEKQENEYFKDMYINQKLVYERILRKLEELDLKEK
jgi:hypothetical protein